MLSAIKQKLENIDYAWTKPQTYLIFIPGISLIIQKIQLAGIFPLNPHDITPEADAKSRKFVDICKGHLRGSMVQIVLSLIAIKIFKSPAFLLLTLFATYELIDTLVKSIKNPITLREFNAYGNVIREVGMNPCNIF